MLAGDHENNRTTADWHPSMGFELLVARLLRDVTFASLAELPIPNYVIVEVGIWVLHCTGLFPEEKKHGSHVVLSMLAALDMVLAF